VEEDGRVVSETLERVQGGFRVRLRYGKGLRARFIIRTDDAEVAEARATKLRELAAALGRTGHSTQAPLVLSEAANASSERDFIAFVKVGEQLCGEQGKRAKVESTPTFSAFAGRWTSGELARAYPDHVANKKTADLDVSRLEVISAVSVAPGLKFGDLPLTAVKIDHAEIVMRNLPKTTKRPATRRHYAQLIHRVLELAVFPCRLLPSNPLPRGFMPKVGKPPGRPYLYPAEDAALLECTTIPLWRRVLWGLLSREGCRSGEAITLRVGVEVDLDRGAVSLDENKTDDPRAWALDPGVVEGLRRYVTRRGAERGAALFLDDAGVELDNDKLAEQLRVDLLAAGVTRAELHEAGENRGRLRAHDLRGTFVTLSLANGKTETWVADRTGHQTSAMINRYRRAARSASELGLGPLRPLHEAIPELRVGQEVGQTDGPQVEASKLSSEEDTISRSGGTGRRGGLKIRFLHGSVGSTPTFGTEYQNSLIVAPDEALLPEAVRPYRRRPLRDLLAGTTTGSGRGRLKMKYRRTKFTKPSLPVPAVVGDAVSSQPWLPMWFRGSLRAIPCFEMSLSFSLVSQSAPPLQ